MRRFYKPKQIKDVFGPTAAARFCKRAALHGEDVFFAPSLLMRAPSLDLNRTDIDDVWQANERCAIAESQYYPIRGKTLGTARAPVRRLGRGAKRRTPLELAKVAPKILRGT